MENSNEDKNAEVEQLWRDYNADCTIRINESYATVNIAAAYKKGAAKRKLKELGLLPIENDTIETN